jgi:ADP-heptose:LPS heptosyltransferase
LNPTLIWTKSGLPKIKAWGCFSKYSSELAKKLKQEKFDLAINLQPSLKNQMGSAFGGYKKRTYLQKNLSNSRC